MSAPVPQYPKVPIIGLQPRKVDVCGLPLISCVVTCDCGSPAPIIIPNIDRAGFCPSCKTKLVIARVDFQNVNGHVTLNTQVAKWQGPMSASSELTIGLDASPTDSPTQ